MLLTLDVELASIKSHPRFRVLASELIANYRNPLWRIPEKVLLIEITEVLDFGPISDSDFLIIAESSMSDS